MQQWQHWMRQGQQAYQQADWQQAIHCYDAALADVWPIWWHSTFVCHTPGAAPALATDEICLPTCCLGVTVRNLAWCYRASAQPALATALLRQTQRWLLTALEQPLPGVLQAALLQQQADLQADLWPQAQAEANWLH